MTPRERVQKVINHKEADRVPIDIGGTYCTGIHVDEYAALGKYLGIDVELPKVYDPWLMLARPDEMMMRWFHSDVIQLENPAVSFGMETKDWKEWTTNKGNRVLVPGSYNPVKGEDGYWYIDDSKGSHIAFMPSDGLYYDKYFPSGFTMGDYELMDPEDWKKSIPLISDDYLRQLEKKAKFLYEYTDYSIHGGFNRGGLYFSSSLFAGNTVNDWLCIMLSEEEYAYSLVKATAERAVQNFELYLQAVGKYIDTVLVSCSDFGTQKGELFSPETFKSIYMPNYKLINDYIHKHSRAKTMFHSCGSIAGIMEYMIEAGVDILNPVQTNTINMEPKALKEKYRDRIVFWGGGIETQTVLPFGTVEEVESQVRERLEIFAPGGGFVFTPIHNTQYGVPPENFEAMIKTVIKYGSYNK